MVSPWCASRNGLVLRDGATAAESAACKGGPRGTDGGDADPVVMTSSRAVLRNGLMAAESAACRRGPHGTDGGAVAGHCDRAIGSCGEVAGACGPA